MANIRLVKGRIRSAKNIAQITKAMELVAASKMKKAQAAAISGRLYATMIYEMVVRLAGRVDITEHPLMMPKKKLSGAKLVICISTNKGLCGGLNTNLFRFMYKEYFNSRHVFFCTVGQKGADFLIRSGGRVLTDFSSHVPFTRSVPAIIEYATEQFLKGSCDSVDLVYSDFISALKQVPRKKTILPLAIEAVETVREIGALTVEPSPELVFETLLPHYLENQVRDAILESEASEHSARMVAMRNATDNALSLVDDLTLVYNKARQEKITYEITDMVTARLAAES